MNQFVAAGVDPAAVNGEELGKLIEARDRIPRSTFDEALAASGNGDFSAERYLAETTHLGRGRPRPDSRPGPRRQRVRR